MNTFDGTRALVREILKHPEGFDWSVQGLGMMRTRLGEKGEYRLHIWDQSLVVPEVSTMHTHPWDLNSLLIAGRLVNVRFTEDDYGQPYYRQTILCGEGGGLEGEPEPVLLAQHPGEMILVGMTYSQRADEIHVSHPDTGTVTLIERTFGSDTEHAYVFWRTGEEWVSAEPRPATPEEIERVTQTSLERWF